MWVKAALFLLIGLTSSALILLELPNLRIVLLLVLAIWSFCRAYYFAFYVIERYIDPSYKFSGLLSALRYLIKR
jgi:Na+/glutamate symporter